MKLKITFLAFLLCAGAMAQVPLKIVTKSDGETTTVEDATHITYTEGLMHQTVHTASGEEQKYALANIWQVILGDTLHNVTDYLAEDEDCQVFKWAMFSDRELSSPIMCMDYYTNFQTDGHQFALFMPTYESAFPHLISFDARNPRAMQLIYTSKGNFPIQTGRGVVWNYNPTTGEIGADMRTETISQTDIVNELRHHLLQHTVFFERPEDKAAGLRSGNEYFKTLAGTYIRVNSDGTQVQGGFQIENEANGLQNFTHSRITEAKQKQNGTVYKLDSPILPPSQNTFDVLGTDIGGGSYFYYSELCGEFIKLCEVNEDIISRVYQLEDKYNTNTSAGWEQLEYFLNSYSFFSTGFRGAYSVRNALVLCPNREFTLYVPTDEAIRQAIAEGLPTWEKIEQLCSASADGEGNLPEDVRAEAQAQIEELVNFVKYHFHFGSEVADKLPFTARTHNTPVVLRDGLATPKLTVSSAGNGTLSVTDARGNVRNVIDAHKNIFVREVWTNKPTKSASSLEDVMVVHCSPGVIHMIDGVLRYK